MANYKLIIEKAGSADGDALVSMVPIDFEASDDQDAIGKVRHPANPLEITSRDHVTILDGGDTAIWEQRADKAAALIV